MFLYKSTRKIRVHSIRISISIYDQISRLDHSASKEVTTGLFPSKQGFFVSFNVPWSTWSQINIPDQDFLKGKHWHNCNIWLNLRYNTMWVDRYWYHFDVSEKREFFLPGMFCFKFHLRVNIYFYVFYKKFNSVD